jgi:tungstate transport system permease protein
MGRLVNQHIEETWPIVVLSLQVSGAAVLIGSLLGLSLGTWLGLGRFRDQPIVSALVRTGMALPPVVVGLALYLLLSRSGPLGPLGWLFTPQAMILAQVVLALPFVVGVTATSVESVPADLEPQLRSLGASRWQARRTILWEVRSGIALAVATALGRSLSEVGAVLIVGGNIRGHTRVLTTAIVLETGRGHFALALALGGVLLVLALALNVLVLRLQGRPSP